jgi:hypothetical protein
MEKEIKMLTLSDINRVTNSKDGDIYSDLYKDVYGSRPRYAQFESVKEFDRDFNHLSKMLDALIVETANQQAENFKAFLLNVEHIKKLVHLCTNQRAVEIIAEQEGITHRELGFYGFEVLEHHLGLKYGSIKKWMEA